MRPRIKKALIILGAVILFVALFVGWAVLRSKNITAPEQAASIDNPTGLVQVSRRSLYDAQGKPLHITADIVREKLLAQA